MRQTKRIKTKTQSKAPSEHREQVAFVQWCRYNPELSIIYSNANGGLRDVVTACHMKKEGLLSGIPDLFLPVPRGIYHGLYIEMKRTKGGQLSANQRVIIKRLKTNGYAVAVCHGANQAIITTLDYMQGKLID